MVSIPAYDQLAKEVGERLRTSRRTAQLTQEALATSSGLDLETIRSIEDGRHLPRMATIFMYLDGCKRRNTDLYPIVKIILKKGFNALSTHEG